MNMWEFHNQTRGYGVYSINLKNYSQCIAERSEEVTKAVFDGLIELEERRPDALKDVLAVARHALENELFNLYRPHDDQAWQVVCRPIMVAVDFEWVRLHFLGLMYEKLSAHASDSILLKIEEGIRSKLVP